MICKEAIDLIKHFESLHDGDLAEIGLQPKMCPAGIWTVGYGYALTDKEGHFLKGAESKPDAYLHELNGMSLRQAEELLEADLLLFSQQVSRLVKVPLSDYQFGALVSFAYNVGAGQLKNSTLLKLLNDRNYDGAALQFARWNKCAGRVLHGLTLRREAERALFVGTPYSNLQQVKVNG